MIITAVYTGKDGALGLKNGQRYKLSWVYNGFIMVDNQPKEFKFDNIGSFLKNWDKIEVLQK